MTIVAVDRTPATGMGADPKSLRDDAEYLIIGFIEAARLVGLRLASYEAWAAGMCALVAVGCLVGVTWVAITLVAPALVAPALVAPAVAAFVPAGCQSSIECALQTVRMP